MRSQLRFVDQDQAGNVRAGRSVEIFDFGTTTPISNTMYPSATSMTVLNPSTLATSTLGELEVWVDGLSAPVSVRIGGASGVTETMHFTPDPATLALASSLPSAILTNQGDLIVGGVAGAPGRFGIGTAWQELVVNAGATALQYANGVLARAAAAGDTFYATGANAIAKLSKGTAFQEMTMNSGATAPQWSDGVLALAAAAGDIFQATGANAIAKLSIGTARFNLQVNSGATALTYAASIQSLIQAAGDLIVGSAANTAIRLAKGADGTYLGVVGGVLAWTTGSNAALTTVENDLAADVALNNTGTYFDGPSVSLTTGTWLLTGAVLVQDTAGVANVAAKLWDGSTVESSAQVTIAAINYTAMLPMSGIVTVSGTVTWKISVRDGTSTSGKIVKATVLVATAGDNASFLRAVKIG